MATTLDDDARAELADLSTAHRRRGARVVDGRQGARVVLDGRDVLNLASNDYLGLAGDRRLADAAAASLEANGVGAGASRLIVGNHREHVALEAALGDWLERDGVRTFSSGYAANLGVITALAAAGDVMFSDALNHASLIDGCRLSRATVRVFPHRDLAALDALVRTTPGRRRFIVSESLFSMDGDVADLRGLAELARSHGASLIVDEAHAIGVFGPSGRGLAAEAGVTPEIVVGTFGKALGTAGAFVATTHAIAELIWNRARSFVFSTGTTPSIAAATRAAVAIVRGEEGDRRRASVIARSRELRVKLPRLGGDLRSPIAPLVIGDDSIAMAISAAMLEDGVFAQGIRPPTVPLNTARIRMSLTAEHTVQDVETAAKSVNDAMRRFT